MWLLGFTAAGDESVDVTRADVCESSECMVSGDSASLLV